MIGGAHGRVLHVDLTTGQCHVEQPPEEFYRLLVGGRAVVAYYLLRDLPPHTDPLSPDNLLIFAPGVEVLSAFPGGTYEYSDGTSMAGPHVAGVVALLWSAEPSLIGDVARTEEILTATATIPAAGQVDAACGDPETRPNNTFGYGLVDAYAAVARALAKDGG